MTTKKALEDEAVQKEVTFEYDDVVYVVPPGKKWSLDILEAQENSKMLKFLQLLLDEKQYKSFRKSCPDLEAMDGFLEKMFDAYDLDSGK